MIRYFREVVAQAPTGEKAAWRAAQTWQILVAHASLQRLLTYGKLANLLGYTDARPLSDILGHILYYCQQHGLPLLSSLVVNQATGLPGEGIGLAGEKIPVEQMKVFQYNWFEVVPPTAAELQAAYATGTGKTSPSEKDS